MDIDQVMENIDNKLYRAVNGKSQRDFFRDLIAAFNLDANDPLVVQMYIKAWENGHWVDEHEVLFYFHDLVEVFKG